jgi:hypothetical protein
LSVINGIGTKTIKDLKRHYKTRDDLKFALKDDMVSLDDDVVLKLKKYLEVD